MTSSRFGESSPQTIQSLIRSTFLFPIVLAVQADTFRALPAVGLTATRRRRRPEETVKKPKDRFRRRQKSDWPGATFAHQAGRVHRRRLRRFFFVGCRQTLGKQATVRPSFPAIGRPVPCLPWVPPWS